MIRFFLVAIIVLSFSFFIYPESAVKSVKSSIYNEKTLTEQLKGKSSEEVLKVLGNPAVKKPCEECEGNLEYWWYNLPEASIFVNFKDGKVIRISVLTEDKRSKEL